VARAATSGWRYVGSSTAWLGHVRRSTARGARLVATLTGAHFAIVGTMSRSTGRFKVYFDGHYDGTFGTWASSTRVRRVLWTSPVVAAGTHTIGLVNLATPGHPMVTVDGYAAYPTG
jgi:hypothetical protein